MNTCPRCGKSYSANDKFCGLCGFNLAAQMICELPTQRALKVSDIQFKLGVVYYKEGKYAQAINVFEKILKEDPDNFEVRDMYECALDALKTTIKSSSF